MKTLYKSLPADIHDDSAWEAFEREMEDSGLYEFAKIYKKRELED